MKTHSAIDPGRPRGPAPGLSLLLSRAAWALLLVVFFGAAGVLRAQTFAPVISQVIPAEDNSTYFDHDGDLPAVIFIKNNGSVTGTISNWSLTDTTGVPRKWVFPAGPTGIIIAPGETLTVFASNKNRLTPPYATNFLLPCASTAYLYNPQSSLVSQKLVSGENCPACIDLINPQATTAWIIPGPNNPPSTGTDWKLPLFSDSSWNRGLPCLGYDRDPFLDRMILYSVFDTGTVDTNPANRTIQDMSGPILHTGSWPNITPQPIGIPLTTPAVAGQSVQFFGPSNANSFVSYPHHAELNPGTLSYTFSIWVRPQVNDPQQPEVLFRKGGLADTDPGYLLTRERTTGVRFRIQTSTPGAAGQIDVTSAGALPVTSFTHFAVVIERVVGTTPVNQVRLYRNGVLAGTTNFAAAISVASPAQPLVLAQGGAGMANFQGVEDEFATWGRALTAAEITSRVYNAGLSGKRIDDPTVPGASPPIYTPFIQTDVYTAMKGVNTSLYLRIPFTITSPASVSSMSFTAHYDDGFVAYINGVEIARRNAPTALAWNSAAVTDRADNLALTAETIPVPVAALSALTAGSNNILAIHALNASVSDQRFLICPDLCYDEVTPEECTVTTNGRLFWITFPGQAPEEIGNPLQLSVIITGAAGTTGNVAIPGITPPFSQNFSLPASGKTEISLPKAASLEKSDTVEKKGVRITATNNVAVVGKTRIDYSTDTFLAHPIKCLGSSYLALCWQNVWTGLPDMNGTQFGIVATADNTHVTIRPKVTTGSHPAGVAYNFILNTGETYMLRNLNDSPADLTGSEITSDSPIAVFGGHRCANIHGTLFFCDTVLEQTLPVALWGSEYVAAPLATRTGSELVRVVAGENATTISINGVPQAGALNKGDKRDYTVPGGSVFSSSRKFLATHFSRSSDADNVVYADPFQLNCQPTSSWFPGYRFSTAPSAEFGPPAALGSQHANVIARNAEIAGVTVNPPPLVTGPIVAIAGTPYSYRTLTLAANTVYTTGGRTHGLECYGWSEFDSYGHSGGMAFTDTQPPTLSQAPPSITLFTTFVAGAGERATMPDLRELFGVHDNCCPDQTLVVTQNPNAGTLLAVGDYGGVITVRDCSGNTLIYEFVIHVRTDPRATAFPTQFGNPATEATIWGWQANPDGDPLTNEQEYALGTNMAVMDDHSDAFSFKVINFRGVEGVEVTYRVRNDDPSLEYTPHGTGDLAGRFSGLGHFEQTFSGPDALAGFTRIRAFATDSPPFSHFFVRLHIKRN